MTDPVTAENTTPQTDASDDDSADEWLASTLLSAIVVLYLYAFAGLVLQSLTANDMWSILLGILVALFVYFSSSFHAAEEERLLAAIHSMVFGLFSFAVFFVAETSFFPPVPLPKRIRLMTALFTLMSVAMVLGILFISVYGKGFPHGLHRGVAWVKRRYDWLRNDR